MAIAHVTKGTYQREIGDSVNQTLTAGIEYELTDVASNIVAATADKAELFSWIRGFYYVWCTSQPTSFEWMLLRLDTGDANPDLDTSSVVEKLQKEKRIIKRGFLLQGDLIGTGGQVKPIKFELYNLKLEYDEELRLLLRPIYASAAADNCVNGILEWRQVQA